MLSAQQALLGFVTPNLRSVSGTLTDEMIAVRYIVDGEIDEGTREELACATTLILADIPHTDFHLKFEEEFVRLDAPNSMRGMKLELQFFERFEPPEN